MKDYSVRECLQAFSEFISDILRVRAEAEASCLYPDEIPRWQSLAQQLSQQQWFALYRDLHKLMVIDNPSIKVQPVLETVFAAIWQTRELSSSLTVSDSADYPRGRSLWLRELFSNISNRYRCVSCSL